MKKKIISIAFKNFKFSRFHLDTRISTYQSNLIKKKTLINYFKGLIGNKLICQLYKNQITGFCLLELKKNASIILVCIDKKFLNLGLAKDLLEYTLNYLKKNKIKKLLTGTQNKNLAANRLYINLNFKYKNASYLYHYIS